MRSKIARDIYGGAATDSNDDRMPRIVGIGSFIYISFYRIFMNVMKHSNHTPLAVRSDTTCLKKSKPAMVGSVEINGLFNWCWCR